LVFEINDTNKMYVVKIGGSVLKSHLDEISKEIAYLSKQGIKIIVIHGGGIQLTEFLLKSNQSTKMVNGTRITDNASLEVAKMIFRGRLNTDLVAQLISNGSRAVGLSGIDGELLQVEKLPPQPVLNKETNVIEKIDYGFVGEIININTTFLNLLLDNNYIPVISCLGINKKGKIFNINADSIATEIAIILQVQKLIFLSDIDGVYGDRNNRDSLIKELDLLQLNQILNTNSIQGGDDYKITKYS